MRIVTTTLCLIALLGRLDVAIGSPWDSKREFVCPDTALCFPPNTVYFDKSEIGPLLRRLGFTGNEQIQCDDSMGYLRCAQHHVQGIPAYGFRLKVVLWSSENDIRGIWCECLREDVVLPKSDISDEQAVSSVKRFIRGHLLAREDVGLKASPPSPAMFRAVDDPKGFELALLSRAVFETRDFVSATLDIYVDARFGRVIRAIDVEGSIDRKPFPMKPWDELGARLASSPKDESLFREYQEHSAFRGRGSIEADFQDRHREALRQFNPAGESTYVATFAAPLSINEVLSLFSSYEAFIHELYYVIAKNGRIYNKSIEDLETRNGDMREIAEARLVEQLEGSYDWYLPALSGVSSSGESSRSLYDVRFRSAKIQMNHVDATRLWSSEREFFVALGPARPIGQRLPQIQDELRKKLE
ncbi:MAG: hypothetical protein OER97_01660 [Gammaproteobacteria bacterium]|nr:hypothetical protein [Gammaproteobacteria bacterium]